MLRLLVDECVDRLVAQALASAGHDLRFVATAHHGSSDLEVSALAMDDERIVVTQDFDFGDLSVHRGVRLPGVILIACQSLPPEERGARVSAALGRLQDEPTGRLTIVEPNRTRQRDLSRRI